MLLPGHATANHTVSGARVGMVLVQMFEEKNLILYISMKLTGLERK